MYVFWSSTLFFDVKYPILIVAEPSISGISDVKRIAMTVSSFGVNFFLWLNVDLLRSLKPYMKTYNNKSI